MNVIRHTPTRSRIMKALFALLLIAVMAAGCAKGTPPIVSPEQKPRPKVGLVLSGGASRGFAHVGVIKVLEQNNIPIDIIVGTSAGSLTGALYAYYGDVNMLERAARDLTVEDIFDFSILGIGVGLVKGNNIVTYVDETIKVKNIEDLKIPYAAVAADLNTGEMVVFKSGPVSTAVRASTSIPGIFTPLNLGGRVLVDGGIVNSMPVDVAKDMGADVIIAVDVTAHTTNYDVKNVVDIIIQTFNIMGAQVNKYKYEEADVIIRPDVRGVGIIDFSRKDFLMLQGERAARTALPLINEALENAR
ncbi:MAG: patatin-like phospholipase family protein [Deltaproteobacteria bacterium]|nr:patatin-like phospholipase family protein [Candidatus Zymogenaceae bacterium]